VSHETHAAHHLHVSSGLRSSHLHALLVDRHFQEHVLGVVNVLLAQGLCVLVHLNLGVLLLGVHNLLEGVDLSLQRVVAVVDEVRNVTLDSL